MLTSYSTTSPTTTTATATRAPRQAEHTRAPRRHPRTTLALSMAAVLQATRATHLHLDHHTAKDMAAAMARNNILHSRSMDTAMARKLVLADSQVMVDQPPATVNHSHHQPPVVTASKVPSFFSQNATVELTESSWLWRSCIRRTCRPVWRSRKLR